MTTNNHHHAQNAQKIETLIALTLKPPRNACITQGEICDIIKEMNQRRNRDNVGAPIDLACWRVVKLLWILSSEANLHNAGGQFLFSSKAKHAAELVHQWIGKGAYARDSGKRQFVWDESKALWVKATDSSGAYFEFRTAIWQAFSLQDDFGMKKQLGKLFNMADSSAFQKSFENDFCSLCDLKIELLRCTHLMPVLGNMTLDLKQRTVRPRTREDFATFEMPIDQETIQRALQMNGPSPDSAFTTFLMKVMCQNPALVNFLQSNVGAIVSGDCDAKKRILLNLGSANSAKTTFWELFMNVWSKYFKIPVDKTLFNNGGKSNHDTEMKDYGKFAPAVFLDEAPRNYKFNREKVNRILGATSCRIRVAYDSKMKTVALKKWIIINVNHPSSGTDADTIEKMDILPWKARFNGDVDDADNHCYRVSKSFKEEFLANQDNIKDIHCFTLVGAFRYWENQNILCNTPRAMKDAKAQCYGRPQPKIYRYSTAVEKFVNTALQLNAAEDFDDNEDFTKTVDLYGEFMVLNPGEQDMTSMEFGKTLKAVIPNFYAKPKRIGATVHKGFKTTLKRESDGMDRLVPESNQAAKKQKTKTSQKASQEDPEKR